MAKPQHDAGTVKQAPQAKPSPAKSGEWQNQADGARTDRPAEGPAEGYDTPHEGAVRDEGTENQGGKWQPRKDSPTDKNAKRN
jgi:hypothetical protein